MRGGGGGGGGAACPTFGLGGGGAPPMGRDGRGLGLECGGRVPGPAFIWRDGTGEGCRLRDGGGGGPAGARPGGGGGGTELLVDNAFCIAPRPASPPPGVGGRGRLSDKRLSLW